MPNKSLQRIFDPPPIFAIAKTDVASNAAELGRYRDPCRVNDAKNFRDREYSRADLVGYVNEM
ncbi:hypothetical protein TUMEXPCC7403_10090 [Tumidithrix helvetica PCC 7403]|uniref:hypothetical protein n=1 Tax=Tumidithrix helvetica TaxID=3457545 RepID=UPI003CB7A1B4